jgi:hypothetical protein
MSLRRLISVSSVVVLATGAALAQPAPAGGTPAPATPAAGPAAGSATPAAADGTAVQPIDDAPPSDMEGRDENPDAPRGTEEKVSVTAGPVETKPTGYPIEVAQRPITLPEGMAEVSIAPHFIASPYAGTDALRARYGITKQIQLGLTYVMYGVYDRSFVDVGLSSKYEFHPGKAGGLDVTYLVKNWVGVKVGVPVYFDPFAISLAIGAPLKFKITDKVSIGGMDDVLNVALPFEAEFAPSFYNEAENAKAGATSQMSGTLQSRGTLRFSGYGIYQQKANLAIIGRAAIELNDFSANATARDARGAVTSIHGGATLSPKKFLDVGATLGFDDLAQLPDSFALSGFLAVRI